MKLDSRRIRGKPGKTGGPVARMIRRRQAGIFHCPRGRGSWVQSRHREKSTRMLAEWKNQRSTGVLARDRNQSRARTPVLLLPEGRTKPDGGGSPNSNRNDRTSAKDATGHWTGRDRCPSGPGEWEACEWIGISPSQAERPQQLLNFLPLPQGQASLRPTVGRLRLRGSRSLGPVSSSGEAEGDDG